MRNHSETIKRPHHRNVGNDVSVGKAERKARIERNDNEKGEERGKKKRGNEKRPSVSMRRDAWFRARKFIPRLLIRRTSRVDRSLEGKKRLERRLKRTATLNGQEHPLRISGLLNISGL